MSQKCIFERSKEPKKSFLAIFWTLVCWIDLILHNVIVLNVIDILLHLLFAWHRGLAGVVAFSLYVIAGVEYAEKYMVCQ